MDLYHVTDAKNIDSILKNGLLPWKFRKHKINQSWNKILGPGTVGKSGIYCNYYPDRLTKTFSDDMRLIVMRIPDNEFLNMNKHAGDYLYHRNWSDDQYYQFATTAWNVAKYGNASGKYFYKVIVRENEYVVLSSILLVTTKNK